MNDDTSQMALPIVLPSLPDSDLAGLVNWVAAKQQQGQYLPFVGWLGDMLASEIHRRAGEPVEAVMHLVPEWSPSEASEVLLGLFVLTHIGLTNEQAKFVNVIEQHVVVEVAVTLERCQGIFEKYQSETAGA